MKNVKRHIVSFTIFGENHSIVIDTGLVDGNHKARVVQSLLQTEGLEDFRIKLWNQGIDMLESMMIVHAVQGINLSDPGYVLGVKGYVQMLKARLGL